MNGEDIKLILGDIYMHHNTNVNDSIFRVLTWADDLNDWDESFVLDELHKILREKFPYVE